MAGTTRDTIDTIVQTESGPVRFLDTAGMRRRGKIDESTEYYSVVRALRAVDSADVALLVVDATVGVTHQDQRLAERAAIVGLARSSSCSTSGRWLDAEQRELVSEQVTDRLHFLRQRQDPQDQRPDGQGDPQDHRRPAGHHRTPTTSGSRPRRSTRS